MLYRGIEIWKNSNVYNIKTRSIEFYKKKTLTANPPQKKHLTPCHWPLGVEGCSYAGETSYRKTQGQFQWTEKCFFFIW